MRLFLPLFTAAFVLCLSSLHAQSPPRFSLGTYFAVNYPGHSGTGTSSRSSIEGSFEFDSDLTYGFAHGIQGKVHIAPKWMVIADLGRTQWRKQYDFKKYGAPNTSEPDMVLFEGMETYQLWNVQAGIALIPFPQNSIYFATKINYNFVESYSYTPIPIEMPESFAGEQQAYDNRQPAFDVVRLWVFEMGGRIFLTDHLSLNPFCNFQFGSGWLRGEKVPDFGQFNIGIDVDWWF